MLTLTAPPANTYSYEMMQQLDAAILKARMDTSAHVIVLTGKGISSSVQARTFKCCKMQSPI